MSEDTDTAEWDGIAKFRWTDAEDGKAEFDVTGEIHDDLRELVEEWRAEEEHSVGGANWALGKCADELEELLE